MSIVIHTLILTNLNEEEIKMPEYKVHETWVIEVSYDQEKFNDAYFCNSPDPTEILDGISGDLMERNEVISMAWSCTLDQWLKDNNLKLVENTNHKTV